MFLYEENSGKSLFTKLLLKSSRSAPIISNRKFLNSKSKENNNSSISKRSSLYVKSVRICDNHTAGQRNQEELDAMHKIVDQTDFDLRRAIEHASLRSEQLDDLEHRSEEMLSKNENLVFGKVVQRTDSPSYSITTKYL